MTTLFLILLLIVAVLGSISVIGYCLNQGFFFWCILGSKAIEGCAYAVGAVLMAIFDANS